MTMNQDNQVPGQNDGFASGGEEFVFTEERKPVNRNLLVLLLIAAVGGGMIYLMYLRSRGGAGDDAATKTKSEQVAEFAKKGEQDLKILAAQLDKMNDNVGKMTGDAAVNQVPTDQLKVNPFESPKAPAQEMAAAQRKEEIQTDPADAVRKTAAKAEIQMVSLSPRGSTCILNSKLCQEGDQVVLDGVTFTIKQIGADFVLLQHQLGEFKVTMKNKGL